MIEQYDPISFDKQQLEDINSIIGREYNSVDLYEISEIYNEDSLPFFKVSDGDVYYDSRSMGTGEHFLFYLYWVLMKAKKDSLILIDEPETFVSVKSQAAIMDMLAKTALDKGCSVIIATHSPHVLNRIPASNTLLFVRASNIVKILKESKKSVETLGISIAGYKKSLLVEDILAKEFLIRMLEVEAPDLLKEAFITTTSGESEITTVLKNKVLAGLDHEIIGIYDPDLKGNEKELVDALVLPFEFLPIHDNVETSVFEFLKNYENIKSLANKINIEPSLLVAALNYVDGEDKHDKVFDICKYITISIDAFIRAFYDLWSITNKGLISSFVERLSIINKKNFKEKYHDENLEGNLGDGLKTL